MAATSSKNNNLPADPNLPGIFDNLEGYYVETPLSWWETGVLKRRDLNDQMLIGIIEKDHVGAQARRLRKCRVLCEPVGADGCSKCDIGVNIIMNMILPRAHNPEPGTYFASKASAAENQPEIMAEIVPDPCKEDTDETESEKSAEVEEIAPVRRRSVRRSSTAVSDENSISAYESTDGELSDGSSDESDDESINFDIDLDPNVETNWEKEARGSHAQVPYSGPITADHTTMQQRNGYANFDFFPEKPDPVDCFFKFIPPSFFDNVAEWTNIKLNEKVPNKCNIKRGDILSVIALWFISGLISLPSIDLCYRLDMQKIGSLLQIEKRFIDVLHKQHMCNLITSKLQWNMPADHKDRIHPDGKQDFLHLIRPLYELMKTNFPLGWVPAKTLTIDESLWSFKGRTYLKRFMKDKPKKFGFLEYAICALSGYFLNAIVHHAPGKAKRKARGLNETNLDNDAINQLKLQKRYGEQGALVVRLVSKLKYDGHHLIGDNAFSSMQLATDLKKGSIDNISIPKTTHTGTQVMMTKKGKDWQSSFVEHKNLPTDGWGRIKKYEHEWYSDEVNDISCIRFHDKRHITLISNEVHGSEIAKAMRTRNGRRQEVKIPKMVKMHSNGKIGVDAGDQKLRDKRSFADNMRSHGWNRKWSMHGIQQVRLNSFLAWEELNKVKDGSERACQKWGNFGIGHGKSNWYFNIGLIKGILTHVRQLQHGVPRRSSARIEDEMHIHTIISRGDEYENVRCAVCLYDKNEMKRCGQDTSNFKVKRTKFWCPHPDCRAHACRKHRVRAHSFGDSGIKISHFHNIARVERTVKRKKDSQLQPVSDGTRHIRVRR